MRGGIFCPKGPCTHVSYVHDAVFGVSGSECRIWAKALGNEFRVCV